MSRENDWHRFSMTDTPVLQTVRGVYEGDEFYDETTASPPLDDDVSAANFEYLMAVLHARNRRDVIKKRPKWRTKNELIAFLKEDLAAMEAALEEEQRRSQDAFADFLTANTQLREVRQELTQQQVRFQDVERTFRQDLQTAHSRMQATSDQQNKVLEEHAQAKVSLQQQLQLVEVERKKWAAERKIQQEREDRMNLQLQAKESQLQQVLSAQQEADYQYSQAIADLKQNLQESQSQFASMSRELDASKQSLVDKDLLLRKTDDELQRMERRSAEERLKLQGIVDMLQGQLKNSNRQIAGLQQQLAKLEDDLSQVLIKCAVEAAAKAQAQKVSREIENQLVEVQEDLESEKAARATAEEQERNLNDELEALKHELLDTTSTQQELQTKREMEMNILKKTLRDNSTTHEMQISSLQQKHIQTIEELNGQVEALKKTKTNLEKVQSDLEAKIEEEKERNQALGAENKKLQLIVQDLEVQLDDGKAASLANDTFVPRKRVKKLIVKPKLSPVYVRPGDGRREGQSATGPVSNGETTCDISLVTPCPEKIFPNFNPNDGPTPLFQLMTKHETSSTVKRIIRKGRAAAGRPDNPSSSVEQTCTSTVITSETWPEEMQFCGTRKNHRFEKPRWLLWIMWMLCIVVNSEALKTGMQLCGIGKNHCFERPIVNITPVEVNRKPHFVFPSAYQFNIAKPIRYPSSGKTKGNGLLLMIIMFLFMFPANIKPPEPPDRKITPARDVLDEFVCSRIKKALSSVSIEMMERLEMLNSLSEIVRILWSFLWRQQKISFPWKM